MVGLAEVVGAIGVVLLIAIFQANNRHVILRLQILSCVIWALYYGLLGAFTPAALIGIGGVRSYLFEKYRTQEWLYQVMIVVYAIATLVTWKNATTMLAFIGILIATTALWQKSPRAIRSVSLIAVPFWVAYDVTNGSYLGLVGDLITLTSIVVGSLRFDVIPYARGRLLRQNMTDIADTSLV